MGTANFTQTDADYIYVIDDSTFIDCFDMHYHVDYLKEQLDMINEFHINNHRNNNILGTLSIPVNDVTINFEITLDAGYYQHASLGYKVSFISGNYEYTDLRNWDENYNESDKDKIFNKYLEVKIRLEAKLKSLSDYKLTCVGRFSNGNAVYKKVN